MVWLDIVEGCQALQPGCFPIVDLAGHLIDPHPSHRTAMRRQTDQTPVHPDGGAGFRFVVAVLDLIGVAIGIQGEIVERASGERPS